MNSSLVRQTGGTVAFYAFGVFNFFFYLALAIRSGAFFKKDTEQDKLQFAIARDKFWNLAKSPFPGFYHHFYRLRSGQKLHYICNKPLEQNDGNLVVFLHGFPDSSMMWRHLILEPNLPTRDATLVFVDLPGYGGSDSFVKYDTGVLEALTEFVVGMRDTFLAADQDGYSQANTIIVGHDWGCVLAFRLASEAPSLADRFVVFNGPHVELAFANKNRILNSASKIFKQFRQAPSKNSGCIAKAFHVIKPLLWQTFLFGYIFAFHLPAFMVKYLGTGGNFSFMRGALKAAHGKSTDEFKVHESLASTFGPGVEEIKGKTSEKQNGNVAEGYGETVLVRARSPGEAFWHSTGYYRDGVAHEPWQKSLETIADLHALDNERSGSGSSPYSPLRRRSSSSMSSSFYTENGLKGVLHASVTVLWGEKDQACTKPICLDGIGDYLARDSEVTLLPRSGHWVGVEKGSRAAIAKVVGLYAGNNAKPVMSVTKAVSEVYGDASMLVRK